MTRFLYLLATLVAAAGAAEASAGRPVIARLEGEVSGVIRNDSTRAVAGPNTFTLELNGVTPGTPLTLRLSGPGGRVLDARLQPLENLPDAGYGHAAEPTHEPGDDMAGMDMPGMDMSGEAVAVEEHALTHEDAHAAGAADAHDEALAVPDDAAPVADDHAAAGDEHAAMSPAEHEATSHAAGSASATGSGDGEAHGEAGAGHDAAPAAYAGWARVNLAPGEWTAQLVSAGGLHGLARFDVTYGGPSPLYLLVAGGLILGFLLYGFTQRYVLARQVSRP